MIARYPGRVKIVRVTTHAQERHEQFWPELASTRHERIQRIVADVTRALDTGRYSTKEPRFTTYSHGLTTRDRKRRQRKRQDPSMRFVWTADEQHVYLVDKRDSQVVVVTSIKPGGDTSLPDG